MRMGLADVSPPARPRIAAGMSARRTCALNTTPSGPTSTSSRTQASPRRRPASSAKPRHPASRRWIWRPPVKRIPQERPRHATVAGAVAAGRNGASDLGTTCDARNQARNTPFRAENWREMIHEEQSGSTTWNGGRTWDLHMTHAK